ncbi:hypothetical protein KR009_006107 [Drosophila setifemur]|nr:hypothetical protein KR009_006107 [Drosophila setifemur]
MLGGDDLDIYEDLDDFHKAEDNKNKALLAWEDKHKSVQAEIEGLKAENKTLGKKIKTLEVNLQNLLDTAKAEVKRKEALIAQLRKERDDICFRRKRVPTEDKEGREHENKRPKISHSNEGEKYYSEEVKNPFRAGSKDVNRTGKQRSRSNSPSPGNPKFTKQIASIQDRRPKSRQSSRRRRNSRSPRHHDVQDHCQSRENRSRNSSSQPSRDSPHTELAKRMQITPKALRSGSAIQSKDALNSEGYFKTNFHRATMNNEKDVTHHSRKLCFAKTQDPDMFADQNLLVFDGRNHKKPEAIKHLKSFIPDQSEFLPFDKPNEKLASDSELISEPVSSLLIYDKIGRSTEKCKSISPNNSKTSNPKINIPKLTAKQRSVLKRGCNIEAQMLNPTQESKVKFEASNTPIELQIDVYNDSIVLGAESDEPSCKFLLDERLRSDCSSAASCCSKTKKITLDFIKQSKATSKDECQPPLNPVKLDAGIQIIENIRLPEMADIGHIAFSVDKSQSETNSESDERKFDGIDKTNKVSIFLDDNKSTLFAQPEERTPTSSPVLSRTSIVYVQPDSTKKDQQDDVILEAAMNMLTNEQVPPNVLNSRYPQLSLEEDTIEIALEKLHQPLPDETVVTSTSNKARLSPKQDLIAILTQSPLHLSPFKSKCKKTPTKTPDHSGYENTPLKKRRINLSERDSKSLYQDMHVADHSAAVSKRFSLGHTDYQFEQIKDEIVLRVKRRIRGKRPVESNMETPCDKSF